MPKVPVNVTMHWYLRHPRLFHRFLFSARYKKNKQIHKNYQTCELSLVNFNLKKLGKHKKQIDSVDSVMEKMKRQVWAYSNAGWVEIDTFSGMQKPLGL